MDTLRTHAMALVDGTVHDNPYYIDPREFLDGTGVGSGGHTGP
jgi:hypothetical protein